MFFPPSWRSVGSVPAATVEQIKNEPMLFGCDFSHTMKLGGPLTDLFMENLARALGDLTGVIVDSRVHMLMPGWYPAIPGWHLDEIDRDLDSNQPDIFKEDSKVHYCACIDAGTGSLTEFVKQRSYFSPVTVADRMAQGRNVWEEVDRQFNAWIADGYLDAHHVPNNEIIRFTASDFHRVAPATGNGWRMFIRASFNSPRHRFNEVRRQTQVYLPDLNKGW